MKYQNFKAIVASKKKQFSLRASSESFDIAPERTSTYVEPTFTRSVFDREKPQVILVSAVGATGKSALAQVLSASLKLPLLDLGKHKPVGDNTLTGLLTNAFEIHQLSPVFEALNSGEFAVIIDGLDEGRSKTTEHAFNAFLDDIVRLCRDATSTSFVILGRTQVLEECWLYLEDKKVSTGLAAIDPFDLDQARAYIDAFSGVPPAQAEQYVETRDLILQKLSHAFSGSGSSQATSGFLSFIGYPPVLDAIVTLLDREKNYHRLREQMNDTRSTRVEIELLHRIAVYVLRREQSEKVVPNIVLPLLKDLPNYSQPMSDAIFGEEEQSIRIISHCLGRRAALAVVQDGNLNAKYEEQLATFLVEHPFVSGRNFRNAVFEAVCVANLIVSKSLSNHELALEYLDSRRPSHYLLYLLSSIADERDIPLTCLRALIGSALEFKAPGAEVEIRLTAIDDSEGDQSTQVDVDISLVLGASSSPSNAFSFKSHVAANDVLRVGPRLACTSIDVPCEVELGIGNQEIELTAPIEITAREVSFKSANLVARTQPRNDTEKHIQFEAAKITSDVSIVTNSGVDFSIAVDDMTGIQYPLVQFARKKDTLPSDPLAREKYLRLRKILTHFRSHSKGALAKYRNKIENPRVAGNPLGSAVLQKLVRDDVLYLEGPMYFLRPNKVDEYLGISWPDLRKGIMTPKLLAYLRSVET